MKYNIFTLHPDLFGSFFSNSLVKKAVNKNIIDFELINWRNKYGKGNYKQIDDKPFGGGSGMVLQVEPIFKCLLDNSALGFKFEQWAIDKLIKLDLIDSFDYKDKMVLYKVINEVLKESDFNLLEVLPSAYRKFPNNFEFEDYKKKNLNKKNITISMTPRGTQFDQKTAQYLASNFEEINILCGRYEGFDDRVNNMIDLELSVGKYVTNGGEIPSMAIIESVSRLLPGFVNTESSALHDSFSENNNQYSEQEEYIVGKRNIKIREKRNTMESSIFDMNSYVNNILPYIEHPVFTRPSNFMGLEVPKVFLEGHHKKIDEWRKSWYK